MQNNKEALITSGPGPFGKKFLEMILRYFIGDVRDKDSLIRACEGHQNITDEDIQTVVEVLKSDYMTQGPKIKEFEEAFANRIIHIFATSESCENKHAGKYGIHLRSVD